MGKIVRGFPGSRAARTGGGHVRVRIRGGKAKSVVQKRRKKGKRGDTAKRARTERKR